MREIFIKHNPYKNETEITIDGKPVKKESALKVEDRKLQEWVEELPEILVGEFNTKSFRITFHGTLLDYEDLLCVVQEANKQGFKIECVHIPAKEFKDKEKAIQSIFKEIQNGPFHELKQPDLINAFQTAQSAESPVNVIATMSAGKSTLINALIRQKLMPAQNGACTAKIVEIKDNDGNTFDATAYSKNGTQISTYRKLTLARMKELNDKEKNPDIFRIRIEGDIPFVEADDMSLVIVDTPGPNNSRNEDHKLATYKMISESSKPLILYVLNATQLESNDDSELLGDVAESMSVGGKQSKDRFLFIVNKLDQFAEGADSVTDSIGRVREYLELKGIKNPNIYLSSAATALDIRTMLKDIKVVGYTEEEREELNSEVDVAISQVQKIYKNSELHLEQYAPLPKSIKDQIEAELAKAKRLAQADKSEFKKRSEGIKRLALVHSGIISIEAAIRLYVTKYAKTAKIKNVVDTFSKKLENQYYVENLKKNIASNQEKQKEIVDQISAIQAKIKNGKEAQSFQDKIEKIDYSEEIRQITDDILIEAQKEVEAKISTIAAKLSEQEANNIYEKLCQFTVDLQAKTYVKLENIIVHSVEKSAQDLLEEYKQRIVNFSKDISAGEIHIDAFKILSGEISNASEILKSSTKTEKVEIGTHLEINMNLTWYKPWTWLDLVTDYKNQEYVSGSEMAKCFFAPVQESLWDAKDAVIQYGADETRKIKTFFQSEFKELDQKLMEKLNQMELCATDKRDVEQRIAHAQKKLLWLDDIKTRVQKILEI